MSIAGRLFNIFKPTAPKAPARSNNSIYDLYQSLYPESVRYALQYRGAKMGPDEMMALVDRYPHEATYLVLKAWAHERDRQRDFLEGLTRLFAHPDYNEDDLRTLLQMVIEELPHYSQVNGTKLAQLSRYGSDNWQTAFHDLATGVFEEDPNAMPCIIAHTPLLGYHHFVQTYSKGNPRMKIMILVPEWLTNEEDALMGYEVGFLPEPYVRLQPKDMCLFGAWACYKQQCPLHQKYCSRTFFIDDTINTGSTSNKLTSFWKTEYGLMVPEDSIRVITDLRHNPHVQKKKTH